VSGCVGEGGLGIHGVGLVISTIPYGSIHSLLIFISVSGWEEVEVKVC
jgi:hypothetical protein